MSTELAPLSPALPDSMIDVFKISNAGGGHAERSRVPAGMTVAEFCQMKEPGLDLSSALVRVNRKNCTPEQILNAKDRVSFTPPNIAGA